MADPLRQDEPSSETSGRDARIEELLLAGLDHYFTGQYELAINVWTRVLFLDRSHARARAYIERARSAVAERQREGEELLQTGTAAFVRGDAENARHLLRSAIDRGVSPDEAMALLDRLDRLATPPESDPVRPRRSWQPASAAGRPPRAGISAMTVVFVLGIGFAVGASVMIYIDAMRSSQATVSGAGAASTFATPQPDPLPVAASGELTMARAKALQGGGHLRDALAALNTIRDGDPLRDEADQLRGAIQEELLRRARAARAAGTPSGTGQK